MPNPEHRVPIVRRADLTGSDAAQVGKLIADYLLQTEREKAEHLDGAIGPTPLPERYRHEVDDPCSAYASADVYVAESQGCLVGVAVVHADQDADELKRVWVDPAARGTGAGSALLDAAMTRDEQRPLRLTVWRWRDDAIRLYSRRDSSLARLRTPGRVATMEIIDDVERAAWLGPRMYRLRSWARVGSVAGYGFESYARILHPRPTGDGAWERRRWSDVATAAGKVMHPLVQWERLLDFDEPRGGTSDVGYLDPDVLAALAPLLRVQTATPDDALAAYWVGGAGQSLVGRSVTIDRYDYVLAQTDTSELAEPGWGPRIGFRTDEPPQLLWPEDHAWVLATEIDWDSTIVAGSETLIDSILTDGRFEAYLVDADSDLSWNGDTINRRTTSSPT